MSSSHPTLSPALRTALGPTILSALLALTGCAAALVPVVVTGVGAHHRLRQRHAGDAPPSAAAATPAPSPSGIARLDAPPVATADLQPGRIYRGSLPPPVTAAPAGEPVATAAPSNGSGGSTGVRSWSDASRYIASDYAGHGADSLLLARGTDLAAPRWVPCGLKPIAVLVDLDLVMLGERAASAVAAEHLGVAETLNVTLVWFTRRQPFDPGGVAARLKAAGLHAPQPGRTLLPVGSGDEVAMRATAGAAWCVIAIIGGEAADFPGGATPDAAGTAWPTGWFLIAPDVP